jgi:CBS domain containing-hemolysin-like protein
MLTSFFAGKTIGIERDVCEQAREEQVSSLPVTRSGGWNASCGVLMIRDVLTEDEEEQ